MEQHDSVNLDGILRTNQIIIGALVMGIVVFLVILLVVFGARVEPLDGQAMISFVMAGFAANLLIIRLIAPALIVNSVRGKIAAGTWDPSHGNPQFQVASTDEGKLLQLFQTKTIVGAAILEGAAFGNLVAFLLEGQVYTLVIAVLFALGILVSFPTRNGLAEWLDNQLRRMKETSYR